MKRISRLLSLLCAVALTVTAQTPAALPKPVSPPKAASPKLVLLIVVDQFRYDYLARFRSQYSGGIARLLSRGAVFTNAHYEHFPTVTAVGHATVLTGAPPAQSGIVGNEWYDRENRKQITSVTDSTVQTLGAPGRTGASPKRLLVSTLSDEMKMAGRSCKAVGISIKDRSAILPVGHMADASFWFDAPTGNFVSSTYYMKQLPGWVSDFNASRFVDKFLGAEWAPLTKGPETWPAKLFGKLPAKPGKAYYDAVVKSPFGNDLLIQMATRAIDAESLGRNGGTDVLSVSFSSNDTVGHAVGPDAPEVRDISIRTDRALAKLFDHIDQKIGMSNVFVIFTADHGVAPLPETMASRKMPGGRFSEDEILKAAEDALIAKYGAGKWLLGRSGPAPYLDHKLIAEKGLDKAEVQQTAAEAIRNLPHISRVFTREQLKEGRMSDDYITRRVRNGFYYERASDLFIVAAPYWLFEEHGTSHGTPFNYDSHVPIIFMGSAFKPGRYHARVAVHDIAPTLATTLDVETPSGAIGRVIDEMLR